jgi:hypothetical protein
MIANRKRSKRPPTPTRRQHRSQSRHEVAERQMPPVGETRDPAVERDRPEMWGIMTIGIGPAGYVAGWGFADGMDAAFGRDGD